MLEKTGTIVEFYGTVVEWDGYPGGVLTRFLLLNWTDESHLFCSVSSFVFHIYFWMRCNIVLIS